MRQTPRLRECSRGTLTMSRIPFSQLATADLLVDAIYEGGSTNNFGADPFPVLLGLSNQGGFRFLGSRDRSLRLVCLITNMDDSDWPDEVDLELGIFTYFGDNKEPGRELHKTGRGGNKILKSLFDGVHAGMEGRTSTPPVLLFARVGSRRDFRFLGLAVPGVSDTTQSEDLVAVWKTSKGERFQNYRARFTILSCQLVSRQWIDSVIADRTNHALAPVEWITWLKTGRRLALKSQPTISFRKKLEQLPSMPGEKRILEIVREHFKANSYGFEHFAAAVSMMMMPSIVTIDVTRRSRDGGRDAIGKMQIGTGPSAIEVEFAMEAKSYASSSSVGVRDMSRLISRLRHRQFGILVTSSWVDQQAYKEIKDDAHPIVVIAGIDIARTLVKMDYGDPSTLTRWLNADFPPHNAAAAGI